MADAPLTSSLRSRILSGGIWSVGGRTGAAIAAFLVNVILARSLEPEEYGLYFIVLNVVVVAATIGIFGTDQAIVRLIASELANGRRMAAWSNVRGSLILASAGGLAIATVANFTIGPAFEFFYGVDLPVQTTLFIVSWIFLSVAQRQIAEIFRGFHNYALATLLGVIRNNGILISIGALTAFSLLLLFSALNLFTCVLLMACLSALLVLIGGTLLARTMPAQGPSNAAKSISKIAMRAWPLGIASMLIVLRTQGDLWLVGYIGTPTDAALYGVAQKIVGLIIMPLMIINSILPPIVADLYAQRDIRRLGRVVRDITLVAAIPAVTITALTVIFGKWLLATAFGGFYVAAHGYLVILGSAAAFNVISGSCLIVLAMTGHEREIPLPTAASLVILWAGGLLLGSYFGTWGVAIASAFAIVLQNFIAIILVKKRVGFWTLVSLSPRNAYGTLMRLRGSQKNATEKQKLPRSAQ